MGARRHPEVRRITGTRFRADMQICKLPSQYPQIERDAAGGVQLDRAAYALDESRVD